MRTAFPPTALLGLALAQVVFGQAPISNSYPADIAQLRETLATQQKQLQGQQRQLQDQEKQLQNQAREIEQLKSLIRSVAPVIPGGNPEITSLETASLDASRSAVEDGYNPERKHRIRGSCCTGTIRCTAASTSRRRCRPPSDARKFQSEPGSCLGSAGRSGH